MKVKIFSLILAAIFSSHSFSQDFKYKQAKELQLDLGMLGNGDALLKKKLSTSKGKDIVIDSFFVWWTDSSLWEKGGNLYLSIDDSMGPAYAITCVVSPEIGDKFMKNKKRRDVKIVGKISSYSSANGLVIEPCVATW